MDRSPRAARAEVVSAIAGVTSKDVPSSRGVIENSIEIAADPDVVFDDMTDLRNEPRSPAGGEEP